MTRRLMIGSIVLVTLPIVVMSPMTPSWYASILAKTTVSVWVFGALLLFVALGRGLRQTAAPAMAREPSVLERVG
jgi:hypothetical protein